MVSSEHQKGHHRHNRVSVGVHAHGPGGLGALIVGGIIGAIINEASHESNEKWLEEEKQAKEKIVQKERDRERIKSRSQMTKWYQFGKDQKCYEMQVISGITDVLATVDNKYCKP